MARVLLVGQSDICTDAVPPSLFTSLPYCILTLTPARKQFDD